MNLIYTKQTSFSSAHRYWDKSRDEASNLLLYGSEASIEPMGHNYLLKLSAEKPISEEAIQQLCKIFDHKYLNEDIAEFREKVPTTERLIQYCWNFLKKEFPDSLWKKLQLFEGQNLFCEKREEILILYRTYKINCVHRHHNPDMSDEENKELYGKCSQIHGHEYTIEVGLEAKLKDCGQVISRDKFDGIVSEVLIKPYDKSFLNIKVGNTSGEIILEHFYKQLSSHLSLRYKDKYKLHMKLRETRKNSFLMN